jgi:hypothetical protein
MNTVEFDAEVANGQIEIPAALRAEVLGPVPVVVFPQTPAPRENKIAEVLRNPLRVPVFQPLTRDEAHEQA